MNRTSTTYNEILGRDQYGDIIVLDEVFRYENGMHGATGSRFCVVHRAEVQSQLDEFEFYAEESWRLAVYEDQTTEGLTEWVESNFPGAEEKIEWLFDSSYSYLHDDIREAFDLNDGDVIDCRGGGRIFPEVLENLEWLPGKREKFEKIILDAEAE